MSWLIHASFSLAAGTIVANATFSIMIRLQQTSFSLAVRSNARTDFTFASVAWLSHTSFSLTARCIQPIVVSCAKSWVLVWFDADAWFSLTLLAFGCFKSI